DKPPESELADEVAGFDSLLEKYKDAQPDERATLMMEKAMLYLQVFENEEKAKQIISQVKQDFPESKPGKAADRILAKISEQQAAKQIQSTLVPGKPFPDFEGKDLAGKPLSVSGYKGKVLLIDFWATW